jgi:hypothetical protein
MTAAIEPDAVRYFAFWRSDRGTRAGHALVSTWARVDATYDATTDIARLYQQVSAMARRPRGEQFWDVSGHRDQPASQPRLRRSTIESGRVRVRVSEPQLGGTNPLPGWTQSGYAERTATRDAAASIYGVLSMNPADGPTGTRSVGCTPRPASSCTNRVRTRWRWAPPRCRGSPASRRWPPETSHCRPCPASERPPVPAAPGDQGLRLSTGLGR